MLVSTRAMAQKKLAAVALAGLLSAGALTAAGEAAQAQSQGGEVVNREVVVNEDRDYTGLWGLLGLAGLAGLAGLKRKKDNNVDVKRAPSAERGTVRDSEVVKSTEGRNGADGDKVKVGHDVSEGQNGSVDTNVRRTSSER